MPRDAFTAIADPTRRAIIVLIAGGAMTPNALAEHFQMSRQAVSKHVRLLAECGLLKQELSGREIFYHLVPKKMKAVADWLTPFEALWQQRYNQLDQLFNQPQPKTKKR